MKDRTNVGHFKKRKNRKNFLDEKLFIFIFIKTFELVPKKIIFFHNETFCGRQLKRGTRSKKNNYQQWIGNKW